MHSAAHVYSLLVELLPTSRWVERTNYGHRGHGYMFHPKDVSQELLKDVIALLGDVVTTDGHCGVPCSQEDYQLCYDMLKEKYHLTERE